MTNKWILKNLTEEQTQAKEKLTEDLGISPVLAQLLAERGILTAEDAHKYFRPSLSDLHDPFLMADMLRAVDRLNTAMQKNEKILVYGDYDVDGTTAVTLVYKFLRQVYANVGFYIPNRYTEGCGISVQGIDYAADNGYRLVIALDCGIKAVGRVAYAKSRHVDFIICDHHTTDEMLPPASAVLDPKREDDHYPYKDLSGCGVGFKLMQAFARQNGLDEHKMLFPMLDLLAMSIASDIVPLTGENRILAYYGMRQINQNPSMGVRALLDVCGIKGREVELSDLIYKVGPRINASGRMKSATEAVQLLISQDPQFAEEKSEDINEYNNDRKGLDKRITEEAIKLASLQEDCLNRYTTVVYNPEWSKGVVGIVASRLSEEFYRPTIILTQSNGLVSGSARSVAGYNIYAALDSCRDLLETFGGHTYAAGLSMKESNLKIFIDRFEQYVSETLQPDQRYPHLEVDAEVCFGDITPRFYHKLKQFGPFGPGNPKPIFMTRQAVNHGGSKAVGREKEHLKVNLTDDTTDNDFNGIAFHMARFADGLRAGRPIDLCYTLEDNNFNGQTTMQLVVNDIKPTSLEDED